MSESCHGCCRGPHSIITNGVIASSDHWQTFNLPPEIPPPREIDWVLESISTPRVGRCVQKPEPAAWEGNYYWCASASELPPSRTGVIAIRAGRVRSCRWQLEGVTRFSLACVLFEMQSGVRGSHPRSTDPVLRYYPSGIAYAPTICYWTSSCTWR